MSTFGLAGRMVAGILGRMDTEELILQALDCQPGWRVAGIRFESNNREDGTSIRLEPVTEEYECPGCRQKLRVQTRSVRTWRHTRFLGYACRFQAARLDVVCPLDGELEVSYPWARENSKLTRVAESEAGIEIPNAARWLLSVLVEAKNHNLCNQLTCTTCGSGGLRRAVKNALANRTNLVPEWSDAMESFEWSHAQRCEIREMALCDIAQTDLDEVVALYDDDPGEFNSGRLDWDMNFILAHIERFAMPVKTLSPPVDHAVRSSRLLSCVQHRRRVNYERNAAYREAKHLAHQHEQEALNRRQEAQAQRAKEHRTAHAPRAEVVREAVAALKTMSPSERIAALATDRFRLPIDVFAPKEIPSDTAVLCHADRTHLETLLAVIGNRRHGFGAIRSALREELQRR